MRWTSTGHTDAKHRCLCHFTGRVQGVGFRYSVVNLSMRYDVKGYVRNLPDGRVELVMEGPDEEMDQLIDDVTRKMNCYISSQDRVLESATGEFDRFSIKH